VKLGCKQKLFLAPIAIVTFLSIKDFLLSTRDNLNHQRLALWFLFLDLFVIIVITFHQDDHSRSLLLLWKGIAPFTG
jgi:hypothetical protein